MKTKTRTITIRGSKTLLGKFLRMPGLLMGLPLLVAGITLRYTGLTVLAGLLLCSSLALWLIRSRTVVSLNDEGISYSSPFRTLHFAWHDVRSAGVYVVKNRQAAVVQPADAELNNQRALTIFVSTRAGYSPARHGRLVTSTDMHFRWNREAWEVIAAKCGRSGP